MTPVFKFLKYRNPIDRDDGKRGGGFVFFDTEFTFTPAELEKVKAALDAMVQAMRRQAGVPGVGHRGPPRRASAP